MSSTWDAGLVEDGDEPVVQLLRWSGPWPDDDPDANFKADVAVYTQADPLLTLKNLARNLDLPLGAVARYVLAKWVTAGSEAQLELGPTVVERLRDAIEQAEREGTDEARLAAYDAIRQQLRWLAHGLDDPTGTYPAGGAG